MPNPTRADEERTERRRRTGNTPLTGLKLSVPEELLDRKTYEYRWADDKDNRLSALTERDDYEFVPDTRIKSDGEGTKISRKVGTHEGKPLMSYLLRKRKDYYDADKREERKNRVDALEEEIRRGTIHNRSDIRGDSGPDALTYTPGGSNTIGR